MPTMKQTVLGPLDTTDAFPATRPCPIRSKWCQVAPSIDLAKQTRL
jgi:hypothetical protein